MLNIYQISIVIFMIKKIIDFPDSKIKKTFNKLKENEPLFKMTA